MSATEHRPPAPSWLVDVIEHHFGLAPYVTKTVWERALSENLIVEGPEQATPTLVIPLPREVRA